MAYCRERVLNDDWRLGSTTKQTGKGLVHYANEFGARPPGPPGQRLLPGIELEAT